MPKGWYRPLPWQNTWQETGAAYVAHGSTGAGNDQVRFDMVFTGMVPEATILTPIRDLKLSREQEISFLKENGVEMNFEKAKYSINKGLWGTSVGGTRNPEFKGLFARRCLANTRYGNMN